ncbi:YARHG domain-containing protein [Neobacillus soli]|uniref:YARHG domain-containing protein n=1 Tax=Neobacillus soli TaxID=220688 RepID=UPI0008240422|nr:YARHG domain-containing protein [Neobacillus soli]
MEIFCTGCGRALKSNESFCTGCGTKVRSPEASETMKVTPPMDRTSLKHGAAPKNKTALITIFSIVGIAVIVIAAYFIVNSLKDSNHEAAPAAATSAKKTANEKGTDVKPEEPVNAKSEESMITDSIQKLNALRIHTSGLDISVGEWEVSNENGKLSLGATSIPSKSLARIFALYDAGNINSLKTWAKEVYYIAEDLSQELDADWSIEAGNNCVSEHPASLPSSDLMAYSGSCGYSIPVLSGTDKDDLSLIINSTVFGTTDVTQPTTARSGEFIFPDSDYQRLTESEVAALTVEQLRLARNEIYARHGYIFDSADLRSYFSKKSWYFEDASYDGTTVNEIEKYNVELIKSRERYLK